MNNTFKNLSITSFVSVECPSGVPVKVYVVASGVPQTAKSIARLNFTIEGVASTLSNIPITEPKPNTNGENLTCSYPFIDFKFQSCERTEKVGTGELTLVPIAPNKLKILSTESRIKNAILSKTQ